MILIVIMMSILMGLLVTLPLTKIVRFFVRKIDMSKSSVILTTFITSILISLAVSIAVYGLTMQWLYIYLGCVVSLVYWLYLDFQRLKNRSWIVTIIDSKWFRYIFGTLLAILIFGMTMNWFYSFDPYYLTPLLLTILYMVFVYKKPRKKKNKTTALVQ